MKIIQGPTYLRLGGWGPAGKFHSLETKLNMSELKKGKLRSEETKLKIGLTNSKKLYIFINDSLSNKKNII
jgi:hypothetical protein